MRVRLVLLQLQIGSIKCKQLHISPRQDLSDLNICQEAAKGPSLTPSPKGWQKVFNAMLACTILIPPLSPAVCSVAVMERHRGSKLCDSPSLWRQSPEPQ